jgi:hypothetical protein
MDKITVLIGFILCSFAYGQQGALLNGKVIANSIDLEGVNVQNLNTHYNTQTDSNGYFTITATLGDTLAFSAVQLRGVNYILKEEDFNTKLFLVKMETLTRELKEVRIEENKKINSIAMGIVPKNVKVFTPSERKLNTANNPYAKIGLGFSSSLDPLLNTISGRTKMLKKEVQVERKELLLLKIEALFSEEYFLKTLKIPQDYIKGFQYYVVEDVNFAKAVNSKNKTLSAFLIAELAVNFNKLISNEK